MKTKNAILFVFGCILLTGMPLSGRSQSSLGDKKAIVLDLSLFPERNIAAASLGHFIEIWDYKRKKRLKIWETPQIPAIDLRREFLAGASASGTIFIWNLFGNEITKAKISKYPLTSIRWVDSTRVVAGSDGGEIIKFNAMSGQVESVINTEKTVSAIAVTSDGKRVIAGYSNGVIAVWDIQAGTLITKVHGHLGWVRDLQIHRDNATFISAGDDGFLKKWNIEEKKITPARKTFMGSWVLCADYSPADEKGNEIISTGLRRGKIEVVTSNGIYSYKENALINKVLVIRAALPSIELIIATHGNGIQLISEDQMKSRKTIAATVAK